MRAGSAPRLAASIEAHVFDGLLSKAYPSLPLEEMLIGSSWHWGYRWRSGLCNDGLKSR